MPNPQNSRTSMDILRDMATIRGGKMPTGAKASDEREAVHDPVEERREKLMARRNRGELKDVVLPAPRGR